ncbi:hypothetical protein [[Leptolyngbya] sp. PCC 7376]|uniref:hypothetical protein n=1 Tax=[Leptolyngbya] sp. PCC 7376 TaxID=111781 RepID=UPI001357E2DD|nr:hypothetical protein [[Leptolyngbya] sp. PCC 7376]
MSIVFSVGWYSQSCRRRRFILTAITDVTSTLRYIAEEDAKLWVMNRERQGDATFVADIKTQFGL